MEAQVGAQAGSGVVASIVGGQERRSPDVDGGERRRVEGGEEVRPRTCGARAVSRSTVVGFAAVGSRNSNQTSPRPARPSAMTSSASAGPSGSPVQHRRYVVMIGDVIRVLRSSLPDSSRDPGQPAERNSAT